MAGILFTNNCLCVNILYINITLMLLLFNKAVLLNPVMSLFQVVILHHMLSKAVIKARPSVLWCYKKELGFSRF